MTTTSLNLKTVELKIAVLGKSLVGKSAITYRFINDKFPHEHDTTIEDQYRINLTIEGTNCVLEILDTAGQDDYQSMLDTWINFADGFVLVYAINDRESFEVLRERYDKIKKSKNEPKIVIVGNKCDLEEERVVAESEARDFCQILDVPFLEVSALNKINVKETFLKVAHLMITKKNIQCKELEKKKKCYCF